MSVWQEIYNFSIKNESGLYILSKGQISTDIYNSP